MLINYNNTQRSNTVFEKKKKICEEILLQIIKLNYEMTRRSLLNSVIAYSSKSGDLLQTPWALINFICFYIRFFYVIKIHSFRALFFLSAGYQMYTGIIVQIDDEVDYHLPIFI